MSITLQINICPGDLTTGIELTVPALVKAHQPNVERVLLVVDCCKPQKTKIVDPVTRHPEPEFTRRVEKVCELAMNWRQEGMCSDLFLMRPEEPMLDLLRSKYLRNIIRETHNYGGVGLLSHLAGLELPATRFVLHYDADMLLYQAPGYDWAREAISWFDRHPALVGVTPRICPPVLEKRNDMNGPSFVQWPPVTAVEGGWRDCWFSTRCFLLDRDRLARFLPLLKGRALWETLATKWLHRGYPRSPEVLLSLRIQGGGGWRLNMDSEKAWLIHPAAKPADFVRLLPRLLTSVASGKVPELQRGNLELDLAAWSRYLGAEDNASAAQR